MSRIEKLIKEKCPNGVEFRKLEECCNILDKKRKPVAKSAREAGEYPYYGANGIQDYVSDYIFDGIFVLVGEDGSVITPNGTPVVTWAEGKIWVNNHAHIIEAIDSVDLRYMYHFLQTVYVGDLIHGNIPKLNQGDFRQIEIAVPPIEVQQEIVRILDQFIKLEAELLTELDARKKQYKYYSDLLFAASIDHDKWISVRDVVVSLKTGLNPRQNFVLNADGAGLYYITGKDIRNNAINVSDKTDLISQVDVDLINKRACLEENDVLFVSTGTGTVGRMAVVSKYNNDWAVSETMYCLKPKKEMIYSEYLMYVLYSPNSIAQFSPRITKGSVPHLKVNDLLDVKIPVPTLEEQTLIVNRIKNFDKICNDSETGLCAEIEARHKQYEYYRDKLLTFERKVV